MSRMTFEAWLRTVCFQAPTPEAHDLAKCAWDAAQESVRSEARNAALEEAARLVERLPNASVAILAKAIRALSPARVAEDERGDARNEILHEVVNRLGREPAKEQPK